MKSPIGVLQSGQVRELLIAFVFPCVIALLELELPLTLIVEHHLTRQPKQKFECLQLGSRALVLDLRVSKQIRQCGLGDKFNSAVVGCGFEVEEPDMSDSILKV